MKSILWIIFCIPVFLMFLIQGFNLGIIHQEDSPELYKARVLEIKGTRALNEDVYGQSALEQTAKIKILNKDLEGEIFEIKNRYTDDLMENVVLKENLHVVVSIFERDSETTDVIVLKVESTIYVFYIFIGLMIVFIIISGFNWLEVIATIVVAVLLAFVLLSPLIIWGINPILSTFITFVVTALLSIGLVIIKHKIDESSELKHRTRMSKFPK